MYHTDIADDPSPEVARPVIHNRLQQAADLFSVALASLQRVDLYYVVMYTFLVYHEGRMSHDGIQSNVSAVFCCITDDVVY